MPYMTVVAKAPPWERSTPDPLREWNDRANALVAKGHPRGEALAAVLHSDPDLLARLEQPAPIEPAPVEKERPLGAAGQALDAAAVELRKKRPGLSHPQAVALAADLNPELAAVMYLEETVR